ncbi:MAG: hypothetical protein O2779_04590 [Nanoarchaeota archaeon]|nr:hypothetical protein [Nanoarchaeota archaeon]
MVTTQILGTDVLTENGKETVQQAVADYLVKYGRILDEISSVVVHVKMYNRGGLKKEYEIKVRLDSLSGFFESQKTEWNLAKSLKLVFEAVLHEINHKMKV